jgi:hypothetical protein
MGLESVDPEEILQEKEQVRFRNILAQAYPDGRRVKIRIELNPFLHNPDVEIEIYNPDSDRVANASIVEMASEQLDVTLHLKGEVQPGTYLCKLELFFPGMAVVDSRDVTFFISEADNQIEE